MQLLLLLLIIFAGGKKRPLEDVMPILETFGNDDMRTAVKQAEELSEALAPADEPSDKTDDDFWDSIVCDEPPPVYADYPLLPIEGIADERATGALARYIALGK